MLTAPPRRMLATLAIAALAVLPLAACSSSPSTAPSSSGAASAPASDVTLTFATFGGAYGDAQEKAWFEEFTQTTGIKVVMDAYDTAKLQAMVDAGNPVWDVIDISGDVGLDSTSKYLEPIDCAVATSCGKPAEGLVDTKWRLGQNTSGMLVGYNTEKITTAPQSWADFFDTAKYPGKRTFPSWVSSGILEAALLADGVAPGELYPLDVDRAIAKLDTIKDDIIFWETGTQSEELLASGEAVMGLTFSPRIYNQAVVAKTAVAPVWNNLLTIGNYVAVVKGTAHAVEAQQLAAFIAAKENNAKLGLYYPVGPGISDATPVEVPAEIAEYLPSNHLENAVALDDQFWDTNFGAANEKFQAWLNG